MAQRTTRRTAITPQQQRAHVFAAIISFLSLFAASIICRYLPDRNIPEYVAAIALLMVVLGYMLGRLLGLRIEASAAHTREIHNNLEMVRELMKANEFLETETGDLRKHRKALLSIMEDAERYNEELKFEVAERKRLEAEAASAKNNMELILNGGDLGYWDWELKTNTYTHNQRFAAILGYPSKVLTSDVDWRKRHIHADDYERVEQALADHLNGKTDAFSCEYRICQESNQWIWVLDRGRVIESGSNKKPMRMVGTLLDITNRKEYELEMKEANRLLDKRSRELEENQHIIMGMMEDANDARDGLERANRQLQDAREKAEKATRAKSDFLASMSHEIRTPMNGIIGTASILAETELDKEQQEYIRIVQTSSDALLTLLNDILDFSKIEAGKLDLELKPFDLREMCEHINELLTPIAQEKQIDLVLRFSPNTPAWVVGDVGRIRQILMNLVSNAVKFTKEGYVHIEIESVAGTERETTIAFRITDTGIGVSRDELPQLFQKFSQGDSSTTREYGGTGLGLAICKQLVDLMGGNIGMSSELGSGSSFWFRLDLPIDKPAQPALVERSLFQQEKVLVIDERSIMGQATCEWLTHWGLEANVVNSPEEALREIRNHEYRIVLFEEHHIDETDNPILLHPDFDHPAFLVICSMSNRNISLSDRSAHTANLMKPIRLGKLLDHIARALGYELASQEPASPSDRTKPVIEQSRLSNAGTCRILLTEDNMVNQTVAKRMLIKGGYEVDVAENGEVALEKVRQNISYDLIFMDCQMPRMDGYEAARNIRNMEAKDQHDHHVPIIALTANAMQGDREKCIDAGMDDYIPKPVKKEALFEMIRRHVG